jgi:F-type H+-transporting ATPase subunit b
VSRFQRLSFLALSALVMAAPLVAAEEGTTPPENTQLGWIFRWIVFAIVAIALIKAFAGAGPGLRSNSEQISQKIAEGTRAREAAEKQKREVQAKLAGIEAEVAKLRAEAKVAMEGEAVRLKALAKREAELIEQSAQAEIAAAQRAGALELKAVAARLAVERAEQELTRQITPEAQASLFRSFVAELERSPN